MNKFCKNSLLFPLILFSIGIYAYFVTPKVSHQRGIFFTLPLISLQESTVPCVQANIESRSYLLKVDTGATSGFTLLNKSLRKIWNKKKDGIWKWKDFHGNLYKSTHYLVGKIVLGNLTYRNVSTNSESERFIRKWGFYEPQKNIPDSALEVLNKKVGRIGAGALHMHDYWLFDFPSSELTIIEDLDRFNLYFGCPFSGFIKAKVEKWQNLMVIEIETDFGMKKFMLDTGCEYTIMRLAGKDLQGKEVISSKLVINGEDLGTQEIHIKNFTRFFDFDGILGVDFLKKRALFVDFKKNHVYIGPKKI